MRTRALDLLADQSDAEVGTLKQFSYSSNATVLCTDSSILPDAPDARASWNYTMRACGGRDGPAVMAYWMNRLQGIQSREPSPGCESANR